MDKLSLRNAAIKLGGGQHKINCPSCESQRKKKNQKTLSIKIEMDSIMYQCWHCQQSGVISIEDRIQPIKKENAMPLAVKRDWDNLSKNAVDYLSERGISKATAESAGLKSTTHYINAVGREVECLVFPYTNQGQNYAAKIRSLSEKGFACSGSPQSFFNIDNVDRNDWLIICEGEMDVLSFLECGYKSVVSVPNGAVMKVVDGKIDPHEDNKFQFLWNAKKQIDKADRVVIATDGDSAGQAMAEEMARRIGKDRCWKVEWPDDCKDANDVLTKHGKKKLDDLAAFCKPWPVSGLYDAEHFYEEVDEIFEKGMGKGESTGYPNVDELYTVVDGQLTVVTGHPSSGKSEFIDQILVNLAESKGWKFALCSFENEPRLHIAKMASKHIRKPFFTGLTPRMTTEELKRGKEFVQAHFSFLYQADGSQSTIESIVERLKIAVLRHGIRGAVIDPYNYIAKTKGDQSETDWISDMLTQLRVFAQAHGIHLWFVAHPTKMLRGQDGKVPVPKGYDISGSAAWFAKADVGLSVHRPEPETSGSEIHIWKCRFSWVGKQGQTELFFDRTTSTYHTGYHDEMLSPTTYAEAKEDIPF
jgi:twinkle protein